MKGLRSEIKTKCLRRLCCDNISKVSVGNLADQVAKDCIEVIEEEFEKFDTKWLNDKLTEIEVNRSFQESRLREADKNDPKYKNSEQLMTIMSEEILNIKNALKRGYPYEEYNDFLSYGIEYVEKSISNTLRKNKPLLEKFLNNRNFNVL